MAQRFLAFCTLMLLTGPIALAQPAGGAAPATAPATTQAVVAIDQTTPRGALKVLTNAMNDADPAAIKSVFAPSNESENKMVDALVTKQQAEKKFRAAAVTAFGAAEAKKLTGDVEAVIAQSLAALDIVPEKVEGDTATIGEGEQLVHMKKQEGKWTLPVGGLASQMPADQIDKQLSQMNDQSKILSGMADDVGQGKFKTADDAGKALQMKLVQQAMAAQGSATQPTTGESAPPTPAPAPGSGGF